MALDLTELQTDLAAMIADLPVTFQFGGASYTGTRASRIDSENLEPGGFNDQPTIELHVALKTLNAASAWVNTFASEPVLGSVIAIEGRGMAVVSIQRSADNVELVLGLGAPAV